MVGHLKSLRGRRRGRLVATLFVVLSVSGCGQFFPSSSSTGSSGSGSGGTGSGGSGSGGSGSSSGTSALYVVNANPALESVAAYSLATGATTALGVSPATLSTPLTSLALNPGGTLLFTGTLISGIYVYVVNSDGSLTLGNSNNVVADTGASAMVVDPSGQWLLTVANGATGTPGVLTAYQIDQTTGELTTGGSLNLDTGTAYQIVFSPNGTQAWVSLSTGGIDSLQFNPTTGEITKLGTLVEPQGNGSADYGLSVDPTGAYLYAAETGTGGVRAFTINSDSSLSEISGSPFAAGLGVNAVLVDSTGSYVYAANRTDGTIDAYTRATTGGLTAISGSPFATCNGPDSLAEDNTAGYLAVACAGGSPDLQVFSIAASTAATPGALTSASTTATGSTTPQEATQVVATP